MTTLTSLSLQSGHGKESELKSELIGLGIYYNVIYCNLNMHFMYS